MSAGGLASIILFAVLAALGIWLIAEMAGAASDERAWRSGRGGTGEEGEHGAPLIHSSPSHPPSQPKDHADA